MTGDNMSGSRQLIEGGAGWRVVCLCAAWCGVCRQYASDFQKLEMKFPLVQFAWLDVEEHEALLGDLDVETFPTLLIGSGERPLFLGPLLPQIKVLDKLLGSLLEEPCASVAMPQDALPLWQRVNAQWALIAAGNASA